MEGLLLALTPGLPALLALLWPVAALRSRLAAAAPWAAAPALLLALHPGALGAEAAVPGVFTGLNLALDATGRVFLGFTALLWLLAGAFARGYHRHDPRRDAFFGFFVLTMCGNLGFVLAADVLTAYLFFAVMTFSAYGMVIHARHAEALRAGRIYIAMAVVGELCILTALFSLGGAVGAAPVFGPGIEAAWGVLQVEGARTRTALLVVAGFGIKAGLAPLHLWLPLAHPVAPTAASALLSGAMIKAGLLAWLRHLPAESSLPEVSSVLLAAGAVTAFYGIVVGLVQRDPKTVLAYSSVSQMGYMAIGVGLLVRSPEWAPAATAAVLLYAMHHGLAKGALFLSVGVADRRPIPSAGGRGWEGWILAGAALPGLALAGLPLTSGAGAKASLKAALQAAGDAWYPVLDPLLVLAAGGTTLLMARFLVTLQRRMEAEGLAEVGAAEGPAGGRDAAGLGEVGAAEGPAGGRDAAGLAAPWVLLVAASAGSHLLLPFWFPLRDQVTMPGPLADPWWGAVPVVFGAAVAWAVWKRPRMLGRAADLRIPAGDLVVPLEHLAGWLGPAPLHNVPDRVERWVLRLGDGQTWVHLRAAWLAERDLFLIRGPALGFLLLTLALALGVLLG